MASRFLRSGALALLALGLVALIPACGEEDTPAPTTPAPAPTPPAPAPPPAPEPPAAPGGLRISATGPDFIEWSWTPVSGATGYDVQYSANETFSDDEDEIIARTAEEISYRKTGLESGMRAYLRVRAAVGAGDERITGAWSTHLTGMADAEPAPEAPARPSGLNFSSGPDFIEWSWSPVSGASGYDVQYSANEAFTEEDEIIARTAEQISYRKTGLEPETRGYLRVRAAAGTGDARVTSPWTDHLTGMTTAALPTAPPAPTGLEVRDTEVDSITWSWNRVTGADGYEVQYSDSTPIPEDTDWLDVGRTTTYVRGDLPSNALRYLRVRAYVGTPSARVVGRESPTVTGRTERPTVRQLDVPEFSSESSRTETSITLGWSQVTDAVGYEVDQRLGTETSWDEDGPSCGAAGVVANTNCVAAGLRRGSEYNFRVRALADDDDTTKSDSEWSGTISRATSGTAPPPTFETTSDLNIRWESSPTSITWNWDPVEDRALRDRTEYLVQVISTDSKCAAEIVYVGDDADGRWEDSDDGDTAWRNRGQNISLTRTAGLSAGTVNGLCVVPTWTNELANGIMERTYGTPELIWASTVPSSPIDGADATANPEVRRDENKRTTTFMEWTYAADAGFRYPGQLVSVTGDDENPTCETSGQEVTSPTAAARSGSSRHREDRRLKSYRKYALCLQAVNDHGASELAPIGYGGADNGVRTTLPAAPVSVTYSSIDSWVNKHGTGSDLVRRLVWAVKATEGTPELESGFDSRVILTTKESIQSTQCAAAPPASTTALDDDSNPYVRIPANNGDQVESRDTSTGFEVVATHASDLLTITGGATGADTYNFFACVRADPDGDLSTNDYGPWKVSLKKSFARRAPARLSSSSLTVTRTPGSGEPPTTFAATVSWKAVPNADSYTVEYRQRTRSETAADSNQWDDWTEWPVDWTTCDISGSPLECAIFSGGTYDVPRTGSTTTGSETQTQVRVSSTAKDVGNSDADITSEWREVPISHKR